SSRHVSEVDRRAAEAGQRQRTATANWSSHICLDLRLIESRVVYPDLVNRSGEELAEDAVSTNLERVGGNRDAPRLGQARHLYAVHVEPQCRTIIGQSQVRPAVHRERCGPPGHGVYRTNCDSGCRCAGIRRALKEVIVVSFVNNVPPGGAYHGWIHPCLQRHTGGQMQRGGVVNRNSRARTIEYESIPILGGARPGGVRKRSGVSI